MHSHSVFPQPGYKLVIAEKPDAAERIASALGPLRKVQQNGVRIFIVDEGLGGQAYVVCPASGHLYGLGSSSSRTIYPTFDLHWQPLQPSFKRATGGGSFQRNNFESSTFRRIRTFSELAKGANCFIHACDYDLEGETIGSNILLFACNISTGLSAYRAKFSTLTESDIRHSFSNLEPLNPNLTSAGRARHAMDFLWGINFSRALNQAGKSNSNRNGNLTVGRVQTPTLSFVVNREIEIRTHVPIPSWEIVVRCEKAGTVFELSPEKGSFERERTAFDFYDRISGDKFATVTDVSKSIVSIPPPFPFNTGKLQSEAYRISRLPPAKTLAIAERLYLQALISYPRTDSQKLPPSINYKEIIDNLSRSSDYVALVNQIKGSKRANSPVQGPQDDPAHPAIFPTGLLPKRDLSPIESKIYGLIVEQFLAAFADDAQDERISAKFLVGGVIFTTEGARLVKLGWKKVYPHCPSQELLLPPMEIGEIISIVSRELRKKFTAPPNRFNQSSLLKKMESAGIGTKATRSQIMLILQQRGYTQTLSNGNLAPAEVAFSLVRSLEERCPEIVSEKLTRKFESELERIADNVLSDSQVIASSMVAIVGGLEKIRSGRMGIGLELGEAAPIASAKGSRPLQRLKQASLGACPVCSVGYLRIVVSKKSGKRFIGCSRYSKGCRASAPVPQKGILKPLGKACEECKWPIISICYSQSANSKPWVLCPNPICYKRLS